MDESMNSTDNTSAMDISPASTPTSPINPIPFNRSVLNTFQQQQESLSNVLCSVSCMNDYQSINTNIILNENDSDLKRTCLLPTILKDNNNEINSITILEESDQLRQRIITESVPSTIKTASTITKHHPDSCRLSCSKIIFFLPILIFSVYIIVQYWNTSIVLPRSSSWQNASNYITKNLIGQDQALEEFKDVVEKHKNFTIVIIEGSLGTGKSYLASLLEKFMPTTLLSTNTLLGLSSHHWTDPSRLSSYFLSHLSHSSFQLLIIDDLDLLPTDERYCQTLTTALYSINNYKNIFILLLQTGAISEMCRNSLESITTKSIKFNMLQRHHIQKCIQNEAHIQNVQPSFNNQQIENILNSLKYTDEQGVLYSTTGCKQIPSFVMLESKKSRSYY